MNTIKDYLEELLDLKRTATIKFRAVDGGITTTTGRIIKMDTVLDRDRIETDTGLTIGADQILKVNGRVFQNIC